MSEERERVLRVLLSTGRDVAFGGDWSYELVGRRFKVRALIDGEVREWVLNWDHVVMAGPDWRRQ